MMTERARSCLDALRRGAAARYHRVRAGLTWRRRAGKLAASSGGLMLHLGCGDRSYPGMLNCEFRATKAADAVFDCSRLDRFADASVRQIFSHAFFEHLYRRQQSPFLQECFRVLRPDGTLVFLGIPDFEVIARHYLAKGAGLPSVGERFDLYHVYRYTHGDPEIACDYWLEQLHKSLFDKEYLAGLLEGAGFASFLLFNYCYPGEEIPLNLGFVASKLPSPLEERVEELLSPFRDNMAGGAVTRG